MVALQQTDDDAEGNGTAGRVGEASLLTLGCRGENPGIFYFIESKKKRA